jgi:hypothetical protein
MQTLMWRYADWNRFMLVGHRRGEKLKCRGSLRR